ncbi:hypothetical protein Pme01_26340 [Planosporangium mesophilum]|uniref:Uncharacterized protein n=2 Tax=Planosporangium mesophilum TaxID=689768 RepID=A0A8J3TD90_9ACTN|nr:hypothetical protein [Planosporangium mesophilum]GII23037.1 hypothetical protein Pme01_26340 [Planosporangium mesophilum]
MASDAEFTALFNQSFDEIGNAVKKAVDAFNRVVDQSNHYRWMLGAAAFWVKNQLDKAHHALDEILKIVKHAADHQIPVLSLIRTSFHWVGQVKSPVSAMSMPASDPANENLANWTGPAANAYRDKAAKQRAAIDDVAVKAEFISGWLYKIAATNVDFAVQLAKVITKLAGKFVQAAADAASVFGIIEAVNALASMAGTIFEETLNIVVTVGQRFVQALGNVRDIATQVGDHSKLSSQGWPQAVRN